MKEQFLNIFTAATPALKLKFNRRLSAVLVCFFIAVIFWFLIALTKDYSTVFRFPVVYKNLPGQKVVVNDLPSIITLNVKASGFKILSYNFSKQKPSIEIDVESKLGDAFDQSGDVLVIPTKTFSDDFNSGLGDVNIVNFIPDSIVFNFSKKISKRVPVRLDMAISFEKQYDSIGVCEVFPDCVYISGPGSVIDQTDFVSTEHINLERVKDPVSRKVRLLSTRLLTFSDSLVKLEVPVEKFTEENLEIPLRTINVQKGYLLKTFPDKINVRFQVALNRYNSVLPSSFAAIADADKIKDEKGDKIKVQLVSAPPYIKAVSITPERVDYILRKQ